MLINLLVILITIFGIIDILFRNNGIENSIKWIIVAFIFGYRTVTIFYIIGIHPIEIFVYSAIIRISISKIGRKFSMPIGIRILSIIFILYFLIDLFTRYNNNVLYEFKSAFILIAIFFVFQFINLNKEYLFSLFRFYLASASIIASFGILEFLFPLEMSNVFGFENYLIADLQEHFGRVKFLFWGSHIAANLTAPSFPIMLLLKERKDSFIKNNYFLTALFIINLYGIYISGNRISWLIITVMFLITIFKYHAILIPYLKSYALILISLFIAYVYSQPVKGRYISTFKAITGQIDSRYDSSGNARLGRAKTAYKSITENPIGTGWGSQGWVHSDVLQVASSLGVIPGLIFFISPIFLISRLYRFYKFVRIEDKTIFFSCFLIMLYVLISQIFNGNYVLIQCGAPLAIFWASIQSYINQYNYGK